jgi:hypothetical protein
MATMIHISQVCKLENVSHSCNHQQLDDAYCGSTLCLGGISLGDMT